jgi:hypothetical protein
MLREEEKKNKDRLVKQSSMTILQMWNDKTTENLHTFQLAVDET